MSLKASFVCLVLACACFQGAIDGKTIYIIAVAVGIFGALWLFWLWLMKL